MDSLAQCLFFLLFGQHFVLLLHLTFYGLESLEYILGMVQFLSLEIPPEERSLQLISKLDLIKLDQGPTVVLTTEIGVAGDRAIMFAPAILIPLQPHPQLLLTVGRTTLVGQSPHVPHCARAVIEYYPTVHQLGGMGRVVRF